MSWNDYDPKANMALLQSDWPAYVERCNRWRMLCDSRLTGGALVDDEGAMYQLISVTDSRVEWLRLRPQTNQADVARASRVGRGWPSNEQTNTIIVELAKVCAP